jgi:glycosyltransferase involved in cell wall biosynthesis
MPRASIIIPTFNRCSLLTRAVKSALLAGGDTEVIIVDDASTDETPKVCANFEGVRVIRLDRNVGLAGARNAGIRVARGDYIALLDDDDVRLPDSLPAQIHLLDEHPEAAFCYAKVILGSTDSCEPTEKSLPEELPSGDLFWRLLRGNFIPAISAVIRRSALNNSGLFDPKLRQVEDWDLWLRLSENAPVVALESPVTIYRSFQPDSHQLSSNRARMAQSSAAVQKMALKLPRARLDPSEARSVRNDYLSELRFSLLIDSVEALLLNQKDDAASNLKTILRILPSSLFTLVEYRQLLRVAYSNLNCQSRPVQKQLKAIRKHLWNTIADHIRPKNATPKV